MTAVLPIIAIAAGILAFVVFLVVIAALYALMRFWFHNDRDEVHG
jgi:hypothetical protein